jgi:hypothetical protein
VVPAGVADAAFSGNGIILVVTAAVVAALGADVEFWRMSGVWPVVELDWVPTAATVPSLRAVTPISSFKPLPGFGLLTVFKLVPSHCSTRVAVPEFCVPTAQTSFGEMAAIPESTLPKFLLSELELGRMLQLVPSHCSAVATGTGWVPGGVGSGTRTYVFPAAQTWVGDSAVTAKSLTPAFVFAADARLQV